MTNDIILSLVVFVLYFVVKYLYNRYITKEEERQNVNTILVDALVVSVCVYVSYLLIDKFNITQLISVGNPEAFTDPPEF